MSNAATVSSDVRNANLVVALKSGKTTALRLAQSVGKDGFTEADYNAVVTAALRVVVTESADTAALTIYTSIPGKISADGQHTNKGGSICIKTGKQFPTSLYASKWIEVIEQSDRLLAHVESDPVWTCKENQSRPGIVSRAARLASFIKPALEAYRKASSAE